MPANGPTPAPRARWFCLAPVLLAVALVAIHVLDEHLPGAIWFRMPGKMLGWLPIAAGCLLCLAGAERFFRRGNTLLPRARGQQLVTGGVFRFSRHPMYLGMAMIVVGLALIAGSATVWLVPLAFVIVTDRQLIRREEAVLTEQFGEAYDDYRRRVHRWV
ncbi:MAG: isoprenylcysteine carboxylmethyltransferase family protein [Planctomycetota bacterium]